MRSLVKLLFVAALIALGVLGYKSLVPPDLEVVSVRLVDAAQALDGIGRQSGNYVFMGGDRLMLVRDNPLGSHVLVRARISQKVIRELSRSGAINDIRFNAGDIRLWRGGTKTEPFFLTTSLTQLTVDVGSNRKISAEDWGRRLKGAITEIEKLGTAQVKGTTRFGEGAGTRATGDVLRGTTDVTAAGFQIKYHFAEGSSASVSWDDAVEGWLATSVISGPNTMTDFLHTWTVDLLFPRPGAKSPGTFELKLYDQIVAKVNPATSAKTP